MENEDKKENEEVTIEQDDTLDDSVVAEEHAGDMIKKLREKLKKCEAEKQEYLTGWQRAQADFVNLRKRDEDDKKVFAKIAAENIISEILPAIDSFDMAMNNKEIWEKADKNWRVGVEYIYSQLMQALANNGLVAVIPKEGEQFDPSKHAAVETVPVDVKEKDHTVVAVLSKGYSLNGRLIRAARVKVGEFEEKNKEAGSKK